MAEQFVHVFAFLPATTAHCHLGTFRQRISLIAFPFHLATCGFITARLFDFCHFVVHVPLDDRFEVWRRFRLASVNGWI